MTLRTQDPRKKSFIQKILAFSERNEKKTSGGFLDSSGEPNTASLTEILAICCVILLNKQVNMNSRGPRLGGSLFFPKPSLKSITKTFRTESSRRLKSCNCTPYELDRKRSKDLWFRCQTSPPEDNVASEEDDDESTAFDVCGILIQQNANQMKYSLVACKQMVGIFVTIWMKKELMPHISLLRISCVSRGIMGCLRNKGCISLSMSFHHTSFCFFCSHLASWEREGDELRRNSDVIETLKINQFSKIRRTACSRMPEKIVEHNRVIWLGDLNYRIALIFSETRRIMEENHWEELLNKDQLRMEMEAGRAFAGWKRRKGLICTNIIEVLLQLRRIRCETSSRPGGLSLLCFPSLSLDRASVEEHEVQCFGFA